MVKKGAPDGFVSYYRVSTQRQGESGLGLEAQREAVVRFVKGKGGKLVSEYTEVETGKGSNALQRRPELRRALDDCKAKGAILAIAKLDRLARNVHFISGLMETRVRFVACDLPEANELTLHVMAAFAQHEAKQISERTKAALARAKANGRKLGKAGWRNLKPHVKARQKLADEFALKLKGQIEGYRARGLNQRQMVDELNIVGIPAPRGGRWSLIQLQRTLARI
ncbi:MAG TPA: recombinase family protein [Burkholderiales bacterium]